jgi:RHS repeat-associated protein
LWAVDPLAHCDFGWYDYGARMYDPTIGRWLTIDAKASKWNMVSPYNFVLNNPLKYVDPDGNDIILWMYTKDKKGYKAHQVSFNDLGKKERLLLQQVAMNEEGNRILSNFVGGDVKWGAAGISGNSKEDLNILFSAGKLTINLAKGTVGNTMGATSRKINNKLTVEVDVENQNEESAALTLGHEVFLHLKDEANSPGEGASEHEDHKGWDDNSSSNGKSYNKYIEYLRGWFGNTENFKKAENEKRESNHNNVVIGN